MEHEAPYHKRKVRKDPENVPKRRMGKPSPQSSTKNELFNNETPMYVRPYVEDPVWLQPDDDEMELLYDQALAKQEKAKPEEKTLPEKPPTHWDHHYLHDLPGDPDLENPDFRDTEQYDDPDLGIVTYHNDLIESESEGYSDPHPASERRNDLIEHDRYSDPHPKDERRNETPMYVRPYVEDPVWLQPDDDEMELLYDQELAKQAKSDEKTLPAKPASHWEHHYLHDLPGDPDLENPDFRDTEQYDDPDLSMTTIPGNDAVNGGFRHQGEDCNHNFECISGKCVSFMGKHPICMPF